MNGVHYSMTGRGGWEKEEGRKVHNQTNQMTRVVVGVGRQRPFSADVAGVAERGED